MVTLLWYHGLMEIVANLRPWLATVSRGYKFDWQELIQEGMIAAWQAVEKSTKNNPESFAKKAALWRMDNLVYHKRPTFGAERANWGGQTYTSPADDLSPVWDRLPPSLLGAAELAYHEEEILSAIRQLPPAQQEYVYLRFWRGYQKQDLIKHFGYDPVSLWSHPQRGAKMKLRQKLAHLEGVV